MKKLSLCLLLALTAHGLAAQTTAPRVRTGLVFGLNVNRSHFDAANASSYDQGQIFGPALGVLFDIPFGRLAIQPSFLFARKGFEADATYRTTRPGDSGGTLTIVQESTIQQRWNCLEIPVNVVFTSGETTGFQVFGGPFLAVMLSGRQTGDLTETTTYTNPPNRTSVRTETNSLAGPLKFHNDVQLSNLSSDAANFLRPWDAGVQVGVGYSFGHLSLRFSSSWGLRNLIPSMMGEAPEDKLHSRATQVGVVYVFGDR